MSAFSPMGIEAVAEGIAGFEKNMDRMKSSIGGVGPVAGSTVSPVQALFGALDILAIAAVAAGVAIGGALAGGLFKAIGEAAEAEKVWNLLSAGIDSSNQGIVDGMGMTIEYAHALAMQFRDLAGGSDEAVAAIIDMGIRMGNITASQMPAFIQTALDLSAATGVDAASGARLLAQAMEDPISALGRFRRMGIQFTKEQEDEIKTLVAAGKTGDAFAIIMKRIGEATSGKAAAAAKTFSGQLAILKGHIGEVFEEIGNRLLPVLEPLIEKLIELSDRAGAKLIDMFDKYLLPILQRVFGVISKFLSGDFSGAFADLIPQSTIDKIINLKNKAMDFLNTFILPFIDKHGPTMARVIIAIGVAFATWKIVGAIGTLTSLISALTPLGLAIAVIGAAIGIFSVAWDNNWGGIRDTLTTAWENQIKPALADLWTWLKINIPIAIQTLSDFWNNTLSPAIQTIIGYFQNASDQAGGLSGIYNNYLAPAIQYLSNLWNTVLLPALQDVYNWMSTIALPFWMSVSNLFSAVFGKGIELFAGIWQNILLPALQAIGSYMAENLQLRFQTFSDLWTNILGPALQFAANILLPNLTKGFDAIGGAIQRVTKWVNALAEAIRGIDLGPLSPGSPTPFEIGLKGIEKALRAVDKQWNMSMAFTGGVAAAPVVSNQSNINRSQTISNEKNILPGAQVNNYTAFDVQAFAEIVRSA